MLGSPVAYWTAAKDPCQSHGPSNSGFCTTNTRIPTKGAMTMATKGILTMALLAKKGPLLVVSVVGVGGTLVGKSEAEPTGRHFCGSPDQTNHCYFWALWRLSRLMPQGFLRKSIPSAFDLRTCTCLDVFGDVFILRLISPYIVFGCLQATCL